MPATHEPVPEAYQRDAARILAVAESHARLTGRALVAPAPGEDLLAALWRAPLVILAHGIEDDPVFFFANRAGLAAFETTVAAVRQMPSRLSAEPALREERARLLARVAADGFIDDYAGVRISARGRRFAIAQAIVWNVADAAGTRIGQAAAFAAPAHAG